MSVARRNKHASIKKLAQLTSAAEMAEDAAWTSPAAEKKEVGEAHWMPDWLKEKWYTKYTGQ